MIIVVITAVTAWQSFRVSLRMKEKVDHLYQKQEIVNQFMDETPIGDFVRTATSFKFDPGAVFVIGLLNMVASILSIGVAIREIKKGRTQPGQPG